MLSIIASDTTTALRSILIVFFVKDTDHYNLGKPLDGKPLGALCMPVTPLAHLKHKSRNKHSFKYIEQTHVLCFTSLHTNDNFFL